MDIRQAVEAAYLKMDDLEFFYLTRIPMGMHVPTGEKAIFVRHLPTLIEVVADSGRSQHESVIMAIEAIEARLIATMWDAPSDEGII